MTDDEEGFRRQPWAIVRKRVSKPTFLDDPAFRSRAVSVGSTGMGRKGAAAYLGIGWQTLYEWLERGAAHPEVEPYGSFSRDYLKAERGLHHAGASATAIRVQLILEAHQRFVVWANAGREGEPPGLPTTNDMEWLSRVLARRWPEEHGESAHRVPERDVDGGAYLERTGMQHDQLAAMLKDPPEPVLLAMVAVADDIYQLLLANGWRPNERMTDEPGKTDRGSAPAPDGL